MTAPVAYLNLKHRGRPLAACLHRPASDFKALLIVAHGLYSSSQSKKLIHGEKDEVVPVSAARRAHDLALAPKGLYVIPGADHRLSRLADHNRAIARTLAWIRQMIT
jgi:fermentation-respiration switch protein FrsA (DUF1100 family)